MKRIRVKIQNRGLTIAELILAIAISAILLAALAVAINASFINYRENLDLREVNKTVVPTLMRLTTEIRNAQAADPCSPENECTLFTADGRDVTYRYEAEQKKLYYITNDDLNDPNYVVCDNVTDMTFTKKTYDADFQKNVISFSIIMTVERGRVKRTVPAAAVIRKNLEQYRQIEK